MPTRKTQQMLLLEIGIAQARIEVDLIQLDREYGLAACNLRDRKRDQHPCHILVVRKAQLVRIICRGLVSRVSQVLNTCDVHRCRVDNEVFSGGLTVNATWILRWSNDPLDPNAVDLISVHRFEAQV